MDLLKKVIEFVMDILETVVFVCSLFIVSYLFLIAPNQVKGASMEPTFDSGDYILTSKISYKFSHPKKGDIIVFASLKNKDIDYIKRIIGIPGDRIVIKDNEVYLNGNLIKEDYISAKTTIFESGFMKNNVEVTVPEDYLYVTGDNRPRSSDSRDFGFIPTTNVIGKVNYRYFPFNKMGGVKNPFQSIILQYLLSDKQIINLF